MIRFNAQVTCIILSLWMPSGLHGYNLVYPYKDLLFEKRNMVEHSLRAASIILERSHCAAVALCSYLKVLAFVVSRATLNIDQSD